jgi:AAA+ ATPase superfamily predicted ATPase
MKPYTFARWLRDIHPELSPTSNPFDKRDEFIINPRLRRYAEQVWWLTTVTPTLVVLLIAPVYILVSGESSRWLANFYLSLCWLMGGLVQRGKNRNKFFILLAALLSMFLAFQFLSGVALGVVFSMALGVVFSMAGGLLIGFLGGGELGVAGSLVFLVAFGVVIGLGKGPAGGFMISVAGGVAGRFGLGVAVGLAFGVIARFATGRFGLGVKAGVTGFLFSVVAGLAAGVGYILGVFRICFWLPEMLWTIILFFSRNRVNCLKYLPHRFDEMIILPLPFIAQIIVEAHSKNPIAAHETIDYLITSTNQTKVAAEAISDIAVNTFNNCRNLEDIADIFAQLTWIPSPTPEELGFVLPQFLDISQSVHASREGTTPYRQRELLGPPIEDLKKLKNSLAFGKNTSVATKFGTIAELWLTILQTAQRTLQETIIQSPEIRQVYIAGNSLDPATAKNRFKGRIDIFQEIETMALSEHPPVLLLYGGRRTGKTSALKYLPYRLGANIVPLLVDLQGAASATTLKGLAENLARQITEAARRLPRTIQLPNPDPDKLAEDPFPALQTWFVEIERSNPSKRFLLCLDEFERLSELIKVTKSRAPLNFIRNLLQHQRQWILLFSGSQPLSELDDYWSDYLINTRTLRITYLEESEARELILKPVEDFLNIYEPTAVDKIIQLTHRQPYLIQLLCYELVEFLNQEIRANRQGSDTIQARAEDVENIIPVVLERGEQYFRELWLGLKDSDRRLLWRILQGETPTPQDRGAITKLARKEILNPEGNAFQVPLVQRFIEQLLEEY